jgi:hypothetical protein
MLEGLPLSSLVPPKDVPLGYDNRYIMASAGALSGAYPEAAAALLKESIWPDPR